MRGSRASDRASAVCIQSAFSASTRSTVERMRGIESNATRITTRHAVARSQSSALSPAHSPANDAAERNDLMESDPEGGKAVLDRFKAFRRSLREVKVREKKD